MEYARRVRPDFDMLSSGATSYSMNPTALACTCTMAARWHARIRNTTGAALVNTAELWPCTSKDTVTKQRPPYASTECPDMKGKAGAADCGRSWYAEPRD